MKKISKEKIKEYSEMYTVNRPEIRLPKQKKISKETRKEYYKTWAICNREKIKENNKRYLERHPDRRRLTNQKYEEKRKLSRVPFLYKKDIIPKWDVINLYAKELISIEDIAKKYFCSVTPIRTILKQNGILMTSTERRKVMRTAGKFKIWRKYPEDKIIEDYKKNISAQNIALFYKCSLKTVYDILNKNCILLRGHKGVKHTKSFIRTLKENEGENITRMYSEGMNLKQLSKTFGCSKQTLCYIMNELGFKRRTIKEAKSLIDYSGENSPSWLGGKSFEPYGIEFNEKLKEQIRKRDNHSCQECGKDEYDLSFEKSAYNRLLRVHHIDYNKKNNNQLNLISLCLKCHMRTNVNRKHWERYFKMKMFIKELFNPRNILVFNENKKLIGVSGIK